ncbi:MAG: hypothetical protein O2856_01990 [Planctomycetota bacterium]|nr:hypothetical protein [Planctomycetota bacterium]
MLRAILTAIGGYVLMAMVAVLSIVVVWFSMGHEFAFEGDSNRASTEWSIAILFGGLIAAITGGAFAGFLGGPKANLSVRILIAIVFVMGLISLAAQLASEPAVLPDGKKIADLTFTEAGQLAVSPTWYNIAIIFVGIAGAALGGRLAGRNRKSSEVV